MPIPQISIIVPVYGVEEYIVECLESIQKQSFQDFEVIVVNDGTTDRSIELIEPLIDRDRRFRVTHQTNQGQGMARNNGIEQAKGNHLCFIDSDDFVHPDYLLLMFQALQNSDAQLCICGMGLYTPQQQQSVLYNPSAVTGYQVFRNTLVAPEPYWATCANRLFKRCLFSKIRFTHDKYEDAITMSLVLANHLNMGVCYVNQVLYYYRQRQASTVYSFNASNDKAFINNVLLAPQRIIEDYQMLELEAEVEVHIVHAMFSRILRLTRYSRHYKQDLRRLLGLFKQYGLADKISFKPLIKIISQQSKYFSIKRKIMYPLVALLVRLKLEFLLYGLRFYWRKR